MNSLKDLRLKAGLTQPELAEISGLAREMVSRIERGKSKPQLRTKEKLATALQISLDELNKALISIPREKPLLKSTKSKWKFLEGLDLDLQKNAIQSLIVFWTHSSTALEGNTMSEGDTHLIITEGLTVSGKSLREHQEIFGHSEAIKIILEFLNMGVPFTEKRLFELHRNIQKGAVFDIYNPIGKYKVENNGTYAINKNDNRIWHDYALPIHVPKLMSDWFDLLQKSLGRDLLKMGPKELIKVYTDLHLGFTSIHPFSDGNGRLARLVSNLPLLKSGHVPLMIDAKKRKEYLVLMGEYSLYRKQALPDEPLLKRGKPYKELQAFFLTEWDEGLRIIEEFKKIQNKRKV